MKKYDNFLKSLKNLIEGAEVQPPYKPIEQAGILGLFEICFELTWKLLKELLELHGRVPNTFASPRTVFKIAYQHGMIADEKVWLDILATRNLLTHTYNEEEANMAIERIKNRYILAFVQLKEEIEQHWLIEDTKSL